jgi:GDSL-like Lipase/Acylhydrolase family
MRLGDRGGRFVDRVCGRLAPPVHDPTQDWRGATADAERSLGLLTFADCSFRAMDCHGTHNPPGYPQLLLERLDRRGVAVRGRTVYVPRSDDLPRTADDLRRWYDVGGEPDLVLVQTGSQCALRTVLGLRPSIQEVRDRVGRALGRRGFVTNRALWPRLGRVTRTTLPREDPEALVRFAALVREVWPDARLVAMPPFSATPHSPWSDAILREVAEGTRRVCEREGIAYLDPNPAIERLPVEVGRCTNGYNLTRAGHEVVAEALEPHLMGAEPRPSAASL